MCENPSWLRFSADYHSVTGELSKVISEVPSLTGEERRRRIIQGGDYHTEATTMLRHFETSVRQWPRHDRIEISKQVNLFRAALSDQHADFQRAKRTSNHMNGRRGVGGRLDGDDDETSNRMNARRGVDRLEGDDDDSGQWGQQRDRLIELHETNEGINDSLLRSKQQLAQTNEIGIDVSVNLRSQREQLENTKGMLQSTSATMDKARKTLVRMARRVITDKIIQAVIILLELAIIGFIVWFKFIRDTSSSGGNSGGSGGTDGGN